MPGDQKPFDFVVIGGGSGGVRAARIAALHGARVALCESDRLGGTCVLRGCIPKKFLVYASGFSEAFEDAAAFGWNIGPSVHDWPRLIAAKDAELDRLAGVYRGLLDDVGVEVIEAHTRLTGPNTAEAGGRTLEAERILIAVGGKPSIPPKLPGSELAITSEEALSLPSMPERVAVVGGGYIAVEFAGIFHGLGAKTVLAYRGEQILRGFDSDVRGALAAEMKAAGLEVRTGMSPRAIEKRKGRLALRMEDGNDIECDQVLLATGRRPSTTDLGLEEVGVKMDERSGAVIVNDNLQSSIPSIYALGDVTNRLNLTPVATAEGHALADSLYGGNPRSVDLSGVPSAIFSQPPVSTVGLSEERAREAGHEVEIFRSSFKPLRHTITGRKTNIMMKLIVDRSNRLILGAHMVGEEAPEIMQMLAVARTAGATKEHFDATLGIHPTTAEEFVTLREPVDNGTGG